MAALAGRQARPESGIILSEANARGAHPLARCAIGTRQDRCPPAQSSLGTARTAERYFRQAAQIDLANNMGNAAGGIHTGAMGRLWQAAVLGFAEGRKLQEETDKGSLCANRRQTKSTSGGISSEVRLKRSGVPARAGAAVHRCG